MIAWWEGGTTDRLWFSIMNRFPSVESTNLSNSHLALQCLVFHIPKPYSGLIRLPGCVHRSSHACLCLTTICSQAVSDLDGQGRAWGRH